MRTQQTLLTIMTLGACVALVAVGADATPNKGSDTAEFVTYSGSGHDRLGTSSYTFILKCRIGHNTVVGSLRMAENARESGTYQLQDGIRRENTLRFTIHDRGFAYNFSLRDIDGHLRGGIMILSDKEGLSGLTTAHFMAQK